MLSLSRHQRCYLYAHPTDMRYGIDALSGLVINEFKQDPLRGDLFIFLSKRGSHIKLLMWDQDGYALYSKRLVKGTYERPPSANRSIHTDTLMLMLQGVKLTTVHKRKRYQHPS